MHEGKIRRIIDRIENERKRIGLKPESLTSAPQSGHVWASLGQF